MPLAFGYVGLAPLGSALTQDHWLLAQHNVDTFLAALPEGTDPSGLLPDQSADEHRC